MSDDRSTGPGGDLLSEMARSSRIRCEAARQGRPLEALKEALGGAPRLGLGAGFGLIAEVKLRAPSAGRLAASDEDPVARVVRQARAYADAGALAISVLTEPARFDGELAHLAAAAAAVPVPVMRKDFLVDPYQVWEARAAGAGGVLLITRMLDDAALAAMLDAAAEAGLFALVECFDAEDCRRTTSAVAGRDAVLVGVNSRDLRSLEIVPERLAALVDLLPADRVRVAESGLSTPEDAAWAAGLGYGAALVGSALMTAADPGARVAAMTAAGRAVGPEAR